MAIKKNKPSKEIDNVTKKRASISIYHPYGKTVITNEFTDQDINAVLDLIDKKGYKYINDKGIIIKYPPYSIQKVEIEFLITK